MQETTAIVQARMGSTRLPGKTLEPIGNTTVLGSVVTRLSATSSVRQIVIATTTNENDDSIVEQFADKVRVVRGHPTDVLARFLAALEFSDHETLLRVTADCPFIDPSIVDLAVEALRDGYDYVGTDIDGRFPHGLDVEVFSRDVLLQSVPLAAEQHHREHVTPAIYQNPDHFRIGPITPPMWARRPEIRVTIDEPQDLEMARALVDLDASLLTAPAEHIISVLDANPEIKAINAAVAQNVSPVEGFRAEPDA